MRAPLEVVDAIWDTPPLGGVWVPRKFYILCDMVSQSVSEIDNATIERGPRLSWVQSAVLGLALIGLGALIGAVVQNLDSAKGETDPDVGFLHDMIDHHGQALEMSNIALTNGSSPEIETFAREILLFQSYEIGLMTSWLEDAGHAPTDRSELAMEWMGMGMPVGSMPGMASDPDLASLREATGDEADRLFLELMAEHHRGGVRMGLAAVDRADDGRVVALAGRQARNQRIEVNEFIATADRIGLDVAIEPIEN